MTMSDDFDLFSFTFEQDTSEERIQAALAEVVSTAKREGNNHSFHIHRNLSMTTANLLPELEKRGFLDVWNEGRMCNLQMSLRDWHEPAEVAAEYRARMLGLIEGGMNAYELLTLRNTIKGPGIDEAVELVRVELFSMLGMKHARENKKALGYRIDSTRHRHNAMIRDIYEATREMDNWRDVEEYFRNTRFEEIHYDGSSCYSALMPGMFATICLTQVESIEDVRMWVPYFGSSTFRDEGKSYRIVLLDEEDKAKLLKKMTSRQVETDIDDEMDEVDEADYEDEYEDDVA